MTKRNIIAILRGLHSDHAEAIGEILVKTGITTIEVPTNSPDAFRSVKLLANSLDGHAQIGAGTVLTPLDVQRTKEAGGSFVVSPNCEHSVITEARQLGMHSYPGVQTPTECFSALSWGATALKLFPALTVGTTGLAAMKAVLPSSCKVYVVGGVSSENLVDWCSAGAHGVGIGSEIFKPSFSREQVRIRAEALVNSYDDAFRGLERVDD